LNFLLPPQNVLDGKDEVAWFGLLHAILLTIFAASLVLEYGRKGWKTFGGTIRITIVGAPIDGEKWGVLWDAINLGQFKLS